MASSDRVESCIDGPQRSAVVFCQELSSEEQLDLLARYQTAPTERLAMLLGLQQQPVHDFADLVRHETDSARWYALTWGELERAEPTPNRHLRRWLRAPDETTEFIVQLIDARGLRIRDRTWRRLAESELPGLRSLAVKRLTHLDEAAVAVGLANEADEGVRRSLARHAFSLAEEPVALRQALSEVEGWQRMALDAKVSWSRQWVVEELEDPNSPRVAWLVREMSSEPPPELWTQCGAWLARPRSRDHAVRDVQMACTSAWRIRTGRTDLSLDEAVALSQQELSR